MVVAKFNCSAISLGPSLSSYIYNALVVTVLYTNQLTLIVSFSIATSLVRWSFSNWRLSICALISGLVSLACCLVLTTSSSNWRTSIACFWKRGIRTTFRHFVSFTLEDKTFDSKWIQSHTFIRIFCVGFIVSFAETAFFVKPMILLHRIFKKFFHCENFSFHSSPRYDTKDLKQKMMRWGGKEVFFYLISRKSKNL